MRRHADVIAALVGLAVALLTAAWAPFGPLDVVLGVAAVAIFPGYLITCALFPDGTDAVATALGTVALGVVAITLAGLLMDFVGIPLRRETWLGYAVVVGLGAAAVAMRRREIRDASFPPLPGLAGFRTAAFWACALAVVTASMAFARTPLEARDTMGYTMLAAFPLNDRQVSVEVRNAELGPVEYTLEARRGSQTLAEWPSIARNPGDRWRTNVTLPAGWSRTADSQPLRFILVRDGDARRPYRLVTLRPSAQ